MTQERKLDASAAVARIGVKEFVARKKVSEKEMTPRNIYNFCPYCRERVMKGSLDPKSELKPMLRVLYLVCYRIGGRGKTEWESVLECQLCKDKYGNRREIKPEIDFSETIGDMAYHRKLKDDGKYFDLTDEELARRGFLLAEKPQAAREEERGMFDDDIFNEI